MLGEGSGEQVSESLTDGVLTLRIRSFDHIGDGDRALVRWRDAHSRHFRHDRIVVDVRGNGGGGNTYAREWVAPHAPEPVSYVPGRYWCLAGQPLIFWNRLVAEEIVHGPEGVPDQFRRMRPAPAPDATLTVETEQWSVPAGNDPWRGRMLVVTDRGTASAGESVAWLLSRAVGARIAGGRSLGAVSYGDVAPYLLPRSGLQLVLPSRWDGFSGVELVGLPVHVPLDPRTPLPEIAAGFDRLYESA